MKIAVTLTAMATIAHTGWIEAGCGYRDADAVEDEGEPDVLQHLAVAAAANLVGDREGSSGSTG